MIADLLGRKIPVNLVSRITLTAISEDEDTLGFFDGDAIYVLKTLHPEKQKRVITHEIVHAILSISGLSNLLEDSLEEAICDAMETLKLEA